MPSKEMARDPNLPSPSGKAYGCIELSTSLQVLSRTCAEVVDWGDISSFSLFAFQVFVETENEEFALLVGLGGGSSGLRSLLWWVSWAVRTENHCFFCAHIRTEARYWRGGSVVQGGDFSFGGTNLGHDC